ncbi:MAG: aminoglycoside phosphotransferase family protein [Candidatus Scalindua sp.]|nr:aminoglycoside phosphotransferase family protein [Candidatus Scalindua sp.]
MKSDVSPQYKYVKLDCYYFCFQQSLAVLAWILFFKREDLITIQPWLKKDFPRWKTVYFRHQWKIFKRNLTNLVFFVQCRLGFRNLDTVYLPVYGHFGIYVHKGYKIFNLWSGIVTKIFDTDVNKSIILNEIEQLKKVSQIDFVPTLKRWDINQRWSEEDYIRSSIPFSHRAADSVTFLNAFNKEASPCINSLILFQPQETKNLAVYFRKLIEVLESSKLSKKSPDSKESIIFRDFIHFMVKELDAEGDLPVHLVFTHGDFCPANLLNTKNGLRIVDWETAKHRSLLFDFYSYFFYRITSGKLSVNKVVSEINEALPNFLSELSLRVPDITKNIFDFVKVYRFLFYVEYVCKLVERDLTDNRLNMTHYICLNIDAFNQYESTLRTQITEIKND